VTVAFIGLGSNQRDPQAQIEAALAKLDALPHTRVVKRSSLYRTAPVGYGPQPDFVNAVAQVETAMPAERLLEEMQSIEKQHGRERPFRNAPRTLDLDLLLYGELKLESEALIVPHPRMHERAFVLEPLVEIAPDIVIPGAGPAKQRLQDCAGQDVERLA